MLIPTLLLPLFLNTFFVWTDAAAPNYCRCDVAYVVVVDVADCFTAGDYGYENACFNCPVPLSGGGVENRCMSLYREGWGNCGIPAAFNASQQACLKQGGNIASTEFKCQLSSGPNKTLSENCVVPPPTEAVPPSQPTDAPTSDAPSFVETILVHVISYCLIMSMVLL